MSYATYESIGKDPNKPRPESQKNIPHIESLEQRKEIISKYPLVIIDYYTDWCGPCVQCAPKFAQLAQKYENRGVVCLKENAEKKLGGHPPIKGVPTFHFYYKNNFLENLSVVGADIEKVEEHIQGIINVIDNEEKKEE
ncbi:MAG: hypothetical protein CBD97_02085 [Pelagibacteraceae bacterium TMED237]|nr:MAG: hypothetical protein CBD97_02085 [Pelagibacteraceae bacterium TMED237]|tara:strand:+ start:7441 stop:7857 length:417 start_codon:yes stop_codon:yes gene_type:complete